MSNPTRASPSRAAHLGSRLCASLLVLLALSAPAGADAILDVSGSVVSVSPRLEVGVAIANRGDRRVGPIEVQGELWGKERNARLASGLEPGGSGSVTLDFARTPPRPGLHVLTLLLEHPLEGAPDAAGNPPLASQRAWLQLALGANPGEAVRMQAAPLALDVRGLLRVSLSSHDGLAWRVRMRALTARGLRAEPEAIEVDVPKTGEAHVEVRVLRAGAPRGTRQAVLLVADVLEGPLARSSVAAAVVEVRPQAALVPRFRAALWAIGIALVMGALVLEARRRLRDGRDQQA